MMKAISLKMLVILSFFVFISSSASAHCWHIIGCHHHHHHGFPSPTPTPAPPPTPPAPIPVPKPPVPPSVPSVIPQKCITSTTNEAECIAACYTNTSKCACNSTAVSTICQEILHCMTEDTGSNYLPQEKYSVQQCTLDESTVQAEADGIFMASACNADNDGAEFSSAAVAGAVAAWQGYCGSCNQNDTPDGGHCNYDMSQWNNDFMRICLSNIQQKCN